jgi:hypothetical protein
MKDKYNDSVVVALTESADLGHVDALSKYIDLAGFGGVDIEVVIGTLTGVDTSNYLTPILQEADSTPAAAGSYAAVAAGDMVGGFTKVDATTKDNVVQRVSYVGSKRYINVKLDYTGTAISAGVVGVYARLHDARKGPAAALTPTTGAVS